MRWVINHLYRVMMQTHAGELPVEIANSEASTARSLVRAVHINERYGIDDGTGHKDIDLSEDEDASE